MPGSPEKALFENVTVQRFMRDVFSRRRTEGLLPMTVFAQRIGVEFRTLAVRLRVGQLLPAWIHKRPSGRVEYYFNADDVVSHRRAS